MDIDWMTGVVLFLIFVILGFWHYSGFFQEKTQTQDLTYVGEKILNSLLTQSYEVPVYYNSSSGSLETLSLTFSWPEGTKNSTRIFSGATSLECNISGNKLYWTADTVKGENMFLMKFSKKPSNVLCNSDINTSNPNETVSWVMETENVFSLYKINQMLSTNYTDFKESLELSNDFQIVIINNTETFYGKTPPLSRNVYVSEKTGKTDEGSNTTIRVLVW